MEVPNQFIAGQAIYSYKLYLKNKIFLAGIVLKPTALASLFQLPTYEYTEERVNLKSVFKSSVIDDLANAIQSAADGNERVKLLEGFVLEQYYQHHPQLDFIDNAANSIVEKNGMIHITDLMKEVFMSRRNFERNFFKKGWIKP